MATPLSKTACSPTWQPRNWKLFTKTSFPNTWPIWPIWEVQHVTSHQKPVGIMLGLQMGTVKCWIHVESVEACSNCLTCCSDLFSASYTKVGQVGSAKWRPDDPGEKLALHPEDGPHNWAPSGVLRRWWSHNPGVFRGIMLFGWRILGWSLFWGHNPLLTSERKPITNPNELWGRSLWRWRDVQLGSISPKLPVFIQIPCGAMQKSLGSPSFTKYSTNQFQNCYQFRSSRIRGMDRHGTRDHRSRHHDAQSRHHGTFCSLKHLMVPSDLRSVRAWEFPSGSNRNRHPGGRGPGARALIGGYVRSGTEKVTTEGARSGLPWMQGGWTMVEPWSCVWCDWQWLTEY